MSANAIRLLVFSDSHGAIDRVMRISAMHRNVDAVLFLGDGIRDLEYIEKIPARAVCAVRGNCDFSLSFNQNGEYPEEALLVLGDHHILMVHGHKKNVKRGADEAIRYAAEKGADMLLYGHTHVREERYIPAGEEILGLVLKKPMYVFNPGSLGASYGGKGSFGYIEIRNGKIIMSHGEI